MRHSRYDTGTCRASNTLGRSELPLSHTVSLAISLCRSLFRGCAVECSHGTDPSAAWQSTSPLSPKADRGSIFALRRPHSRLCLGEQRSFEKQRERATRLTRGLAWGPGAVFRMRGPGLKSASRPVAFNTVLVLNDNTALLLKVKTVLVLKVNTVLVLKAMSRFRT